MMNIKESVKEYRALLDQKAQMKAKFEFDVAPINEKLAKIEGEIMQAMEETGVDSFKTEYGTAYKSTKVSVTCSDKGAFMDFVKSTDNWGLLEVRPSKTAVEEFLSGTNLLPTGVSYKTFTTVNIRKSL
jgi:hypothetical protein